MNCQEVQLHLSLYLYGELEFSAEEDVEQHLAGCSLCQLALVREKSWHSSLHAETKDAPLELLSECRRELHAALTADRPLTLDLPWWRRLDWPIRLTGQWSGRLAFASLFVFFGFTLSRWAVRIPLLSGLGSNVAEADLTPGFTRVRGVQAGNGNQVHILIDRVQPDEVTGTLDDNGVRQLLLQASKDPGDPGLRVDSVEMLKGQNGSDIRDALLYSVQHDENPAVRLKALEGLRHFRSDQVTRDALRSVLETDASPAVRTEAIDVLVPTDSAGSVSPELAATLQSVIESEPSNDYLRARCQQILQTSKTPGLY